MRKDLLGLSLFFGFISIAIKGQSQSFIKSNKYSVSSSLFISNTNSLPFWLGANQNGEVPIESQFIQLGAEVQHEYDSLYNRDRDLNKFSLGYGARAITNVGKVNQFRLTEAYLKGRFKDLEIYAGRRREIVGLVDTLMTSGSYIWSGNALPIPKVQISIPNYTPILGKGLLSIKGSFAHGWFGSTDSIKNSYLHQKTFYARVGRPYWKMKFYAGFNHQVQWAGKPSIAFFDPIDGQTISQFPSNFATFFNVILGKSLINNTEYGNIDPIKGGVPLYESTNRAGNHLGTIDMGIEFNLFGSDIFLYRQSIYEDGSLFFLSNIRDGLTSLSIKLNNKKYIKSLLVEYFDSRSQAGELGGRINIPQLRGLDNYFNNGVYKEGWTYRGKIIGSPLFSTNKEYFSKSSASSDLIQEPVYIFNNRVQTINLTISGSIVNLNYKSKFLYSKNLGNYFEKISNSTFSISQMASYSLPSNLMIHINISVDLESQFNNRFGLQLKLTQPF